MKKLFKDLILKTIGRKLKKSFAVIDLSCEEIFVIGVVLNAAGSYSFTGFHRVPRGKCIPGDRDTGVYPSPDRVREAILGLEKKTGKALHYIYAGISSVSAGIRPSTGTIAISRYGREVTRRDIKKCVETGSIARIPLDKEVLHKIVTGFSVDGEVPVHDPEGLEAFKLGVGVNILTVNMSTVRNFSKCIKDAGYIPEGFVFSPMVFAAKVMSMEERSDRTVFISIRENRVDILFFIFGKLNDCGVFSRTVYSHTEGGVSAAADISDTRYGWLIDELERMRGWAGMRRVVISPVRTVPEEFINYIENRTGLPVRVALPVLSGDSLPEDPSGYAAALGVFEYVRDEIMSGKGIYPGFLPF